MSRCSGPLVNHCKVCPKSGCCSTSCGVIKIWGCARCSKTQCCTGLYACCRNCPTCGHATLSTAVYEEEKGRGRREEKKTRAVETKESKEGKGSSSSDVSEGETGSGSSSSGGESSSATDEETEPPLLIAQYMAFLAGKAKFSDVVFVVGKEATRIPAHRLVLATASPVFEAMLYPNSDFPDLKMSLPIEVKLSREEPAPFLAMLRCIYSDTIAITSSNVQALLRLSKKYHIDKLQLLCAEWMEDDVSIENICHLFELAPTLFPDKDFGMPFIRENAEAVLTAPGWLTLSKPRVAAIISDDELGADEFVILNAVRAWGLAQVERASPGVTRSDEEEKEAIQKVIVGLVQHIRFPLMSVEDIASLVVPSGILEAELLVNLFTYVSQPFDERDPTGSVFSSKSRGGALSGDSTILKTPMQRKEMLRFFGANGNPPSRKPSLALLWRGSTNGMSAEEFHRRCNKKGPTLTVIESKAGAIFGGYTDDEWSSTAGTHAGAAWLFSLQNSTVKTPFKLLPTPTGSSTTLVGMPLITNNSLYGPTFGGGHDLHISASMGSSGCYASPATYRSQAAGFPTVAIAGTSLAGASTFTVKEIEVFAVTNYIPPARVAK